MYRSVVVLFFIYIIITIMGCAGVFNWTYVDNDFQQYVKDFEKDFNVDVNVSIKYSDSMDWENVGVCYPMNDMILINISSFKNLYHSDKKAVVYHELGHCVLHLPHRDKRSETGVSCSLMNTYFSSGIFNNAKDRKCYIDEMINGHNDCLPGC